MGVLRFIFYCFLGYAALEILVYIITEDRKNKEKEKKAQKEAELDAWLGVLSACYHHATRQRKFTSGIYLCALSKCCWMLRHSQMCDKRVALLALRGLGYLDNADDLEGRPGLRDFDRLDNTVEEVLKRRRTE